MVARILTPLDGTQAAEAGLLWARQAATRCGATLHLLTILEEGQKGSLCPQEADAYLRAHGQGLRACGLAAQWEVTSGPAADIILARSQDSDLTVMTYGTSRWLFGGVLDRVLHRIERPLVIVRTAAGRIPTPPPVERILVPLDSSPPPATALRVAQGLARSMGASLVLCHVVPPLGYYRDPSQAPPGVARAIEALLEEARAFLRLAAERVIREGIPVETSVTIGEAPWEILRTARGCGAGLIVMATRSGNRLSHVLGSVANAVVQSSHLPSLLVRYNGAH